MPVSLLPAASAVVGEHDKAYAATKSSAALMTYNPAQRLGASFERGGVLVHAGPTTLGLALQEWGYGPWLRTTPAVAPSAFGNRVSYAYPGIDEWWINGPSGLEQGFTVAAPPRGGHLAPLTLALALSGNASAKIAPGRRTVIFRHGGTGSLRYAGLRAQDALGRALPTRLSLSGARMLLHVDARGARYPLTIDPFVQQGGSLNEAASPTVAISGDGKTALVGQESFGSEPFSPQGAAWVFVRSGEEWVQQAELKGGAEVGLGSFGDAVALSANGNTAVIGGYTDNGANGGKQGRGVGAAWVFTRSAGEWSQQAKLTANDERGEGDFGLSVAVSSDGGTALIGGPFDRHGFEEQGEGSGDVLGAAWVFTRAGSAWSQQGLALIGFEQTTAFAQFGSAVALSGDGNTALIGGQGEDSNKGAGWVFTRSAGTWVKDQKLSGKGNKEAGIGPVALAGNGSTALLGGADDNGDKGAAWVYKRAGSSWTEQGEKLLPREALGFFGRGVALSFDGSRALIAQTGQVDVFALGGATAKQVQALSPSGGVGRGGETAGDDVALAEEGEEALIAGNTGVFAYGYEVGPPGPPVWDGNGAPLATGAPTTVTSKGSLVMALSNSTAVTCKAKGSETIENPAGGAAGKGQLSALALSGCKEATKFSICPKGEKLAVAASGLPWAMELQPGTPIGDLLTNVALALDCKKKGMTTSSNELTGSITPQVGNSALEFNSGSGSLSASQGGTATLSGSYALKGPKNAAVITAETS